VGVSTNQSPDPETAETTATPPDPREKTIHVLQTVLTLVSAIALCLAATVVLLVARGPAASLVTGTTPSPTASATYFTKYIDVNPGAVKPGAIVVEIHSDYQCPWCARAEQIYGDALGQLSQSGDIDLRIHIRTIIGDQVIKNDSSERAGIAAVCANQVGHFWAYHTTVFANQPAEGVGYTDDQLRSVFAAQAGITGADLTTFQTCYDTRATADFVTQMEQEGAAAGVNGTPAFFVNGKQVSFDLQANSSTVQPITAAQMLSGLQQIVQ